MELWRGTGLLRFLQENTFSLPSSGHPEGYFEAFAVLYREFANALSVWKPGSSIPLPSTLPGIEAGVRGMRFIERVIESNRRESWVEF
jgi:hypothetical protein